MKRLLREAYRLHQHILSDTLRNYQLTFHGALMANAIDVDYDNVEQDVILLLEQASNNIPTLSSGNS